MDNKETTCIIEEIRDLEKKHDIEKYPLYDIYGNQYLISKHVLKTLKCRTVLLKTITYYSLNSSCDYGREVKGAITTISVVLPSNKEIVILPNLSSSVRRILEPDFTSSNEEDE